jgi:hypothetical protein
VLFSIRTTGGERACALVHNGICRGHRVANGRSGHFLLDSSAWGRHGSVFLPRDEKTGTGSLNPRSARLPNEIKPTASPISAAATASIRICPSLAVAFLAQAQLLRLEPVHLAPPVVAEPRVLSEDLRVNYATYIGERGEFDEEDEREEDAMSLESSAAAAKRARQFATIGPGLPRLPPPMTLVPFSSQMSTSPLSFCHSMSE